jgi:hypothetical protein
VYDCCAPDGKPEADENDRKLYESISHGKTSRCLVVIEDWAATIAANVPPQHAAVFGEARFDIAQPSPIK